MPGLVVVPGVVFCSFAFVFLGAWAESLINNDNAKKDDCEQALILRAHECKPYYLTTEEIKLIERLGEKQ